MIGMFDCCGKRHDGQHPTAAKMQYTPRNSNPPNSKCGVGIVFGSDGTGGLIVKGFIPNSSAAQSGQISEGDLLVTVDCIEVHRWPVAEIAPLMLGAPGSVVRLGFRRKVVHVSSARGVGGTDDSYEDADGGWEGGASNTSQVSVGNGAPAPVPKLWEKGGTPRNEYSQKSSEDKATNEYYEVRLTRTMTGSARSVQ